MILHVTGRNGHILDAVSLNGGRLAYQSGLARPYVEGPRAQKPGLSDADLYALAAGTSNGYLTFSSSGGDTDA